MTNSSISYNFQAELERWDYGNYFWEVEYTRCPGAVFPTKLSFDLQPHAEVLFFLLYIYNKIYIYIYIIKNIYIYIKSTFSPCIGIKEYLHAFCTFGSPLTVLKLRISINNLFCNLFIYLFNFSFSEWFLYVYLKLIKAVPLTSKWEETKTS